MFRDFIRKETNKVLSVVVMLLVAGLISIQPSVVVAEEGSHDCSGGHEKSTGIAVNVVTEFRCLYSTPNFDIYYDDRTNSTVVEYMSGQLENAFEAFGCASDVGGYTPDPFSIDCQDDVGNPVTGMGLRWPKANSDGKISITIGGSYIPADGFSRQEIIQFKPGDFPGASFSREFIYHEVFHQFQWAYTNDHAIRHVRNEELFESMADFATAKALNLSTPCIGDRGCLDSVADMTRRPWTPAYEGEYWYQYLHKFEPEAPDDLGDLFEEILLKYNDGTDDSNTVFEKLYGIEISSWYRAWTLSNDAPMEVRTAARSNAENYEDIKEERRPNSEAPYKPEEIRLVRVDHEKGESIAFSTINFSGPMIVTATACDQDFYGRNLLATVENGESFVFENTQSDCDYHYVTLASVPHPAAGTEAFRFKIEVVEGPELIEQEVPDLQNKSVEEASALLSQKNLTLDTDLPGDMCISSTDPVAGSVVAEGTVVGVASALSCNPTYVVR